MFLLTPSSSDEEGSGPADLPHSAAPLTHSGRTRCFLQPQQQSCSHKGYRDRDRPGEDTHPAQRNATAAASPAGHFHSEDANGEQEVPDTAGVPRPTRLELGK